MDATFIAYQIAGLPMGVIQILKDDEAYTITKTGENGWYLYHLSYEMEEIAVMDGGPETDFMQVCQRIAEHIKNHKEGTLHA